MRTPLADRHVERGARMECFAGWDLPIRFQGIVKEHLHTRNAVSVFDTCHMGEFEFRGAGAGAGLDGLLTQRIGSLRVGQARYGYLLNDQGGVLDDVICFRTGEDGYLLVVNAGTRERDAAWIRGRLDPAVSFEDLSERTGKIDVQGPKARGAVEQAFGIRFPDLPFFGCAHVEACGFRMLASRTGYTGEFGYELYLPVDRTVEAWDRLLAVEEVLPAGLGARDTLRLEMGYPLYGHELSEDRTPAGIARKPFLDLEKPFPGRDAVRERMDSGAEEPLVGLRLRGRRAARAGAAVLRDGARVGTVTSGCFAPSLGVAAALAYVNPGFASEGTGVLLAGAGFEVEAEVAALPLYRNGTARRG